MSKIVRRAAIALLAYFIVVFPVDAASLTRHLVGGSTELALGIAQTIWVMRAIILAVAFLVAMSPPVLKRLVDMIDVSPEDRVKLMVAYIGASGFLYSVVAAILLLETAP